MKEVLKELEARLRNEDISFDELQRLEKRAAIARSLEEFRKFKVDARKLRLEMRNIGHKAKSEGVRFWVTVTAPTLGAIALVATLLFQIHQFNENSQRSRQATEEAQFRQVVRGVSMPKGLSTLTYLTMLASFTSSAHSASIRKQARVVAVTALAADSKVSSYQDLFEAVFPKVTFRDLPDLIRLIRLQRAFVTFNGNSADRAQNSLSKLEKERSPVVAPFTGTRSLPRAVTAARRAPGSFHAPPAPSAVQWLADRSYRIHFLMHIIRQSDSDLSTLKGQATVASNAVARALRMKPPGFAPDLSRTLFWRADLRNTSFGRAQLSNAWVESSDVSGADFGEVDKFQGSIWAFTQWWRAKRVSPLLLKYLEYYYAFDPKTNYYGTPPSEAEYKKAVERLRGLVAHGGN